jgi:hypothetical protein
MTTGVVAAARGQGLEPSNAVNELLNPTFINDNYPVGITFPDMEQSMSYKQNFGEQTYLAGWRHAGPVYPNGDATTTSYFTTLSNQWLYSWQDYQLAPFLAGYIPRVLKLFGIGTLFPTGNTNPTTNNLQADRQNSSTGGATGLAKITSNTTLSSIPTGSTSMDTTAIWVRSADWVANVFPDDTETHVKFGAQIKIDANDKLRLNNFAGMFIYEDVTGAGGVAERRVTTVIFKDASSTYVLPTGTLTLPMAQYNWNGVDSQNYGTGGQNFFGAGITTILNQYELDQDDYGDFTKVTYYHELKAGTGRTVSMSLFFSENAKYMYDEDGVNSGAIQFYDPFIEYAAPPAPPALPLPSVGDGLNCKQFYNFANDYDMTLTAAASTSDPAAFASPNGVNQVNSIASIIDSNDVLVGAPVLSTQSTGWPTDPLGDGSDWVAFGIPPSGFPYSSLITPQGSPFTSEAGAITIMTDIYLPSGVSSSGWIAQLTDNTSSTGPNKGGLLDTLNPVSQRAILGRRNISAYSNQIPSTGRIRIAVVLDGSSTKFYINSSTESTYSANSGSSTFNRLRLFSGPNGGDQYEGHMRNFAIYDGVLPVSDINDFMTREYEAGTPPPASGPVATITSKQNLPSGEEFSDPLNQSFSTSTDGSGSGATLICTARTFDSGMESYAVTNFALGAGGTGYQVGDSLVMQLGPSFDPYPSCTVASVS